MSNWTRSGPVVVEVDGSTEGLRVVDYAGQEAFRAGAELVLVAPYRNYPAYSPMMPAYLPQPLSAGADEILHRAVEHVRRQYGGDLVVKAESMEGSRLKVLREFAREARILVVGREHDRGPAGLASAQGNLAVAGRSGCPVIVVPPTWRPASADRAVVVGIDGTPLSLEAVEFAFRAASDRGAALTVVHSHHMPYRRLAADDGTWQERAGLTVSETLAGWDEEYPNVKVIRLLTTRPVVAALARESLQADLIVVGAHSGPLPIGDPVTRRTIAEMSSPVAIVAHHVTPAERARRRRELHDRANVISPTY